MNWRRCSSVTGSPFERLPVVSAAFRRSIAAGYSTSTFCDQARDVLLDHQLPRARVLHDLHSGVRLAVDLVAVVMVAVPVGVDYVAHRERRELPDLGHHLAGRARQDVRIHHYDVGVVDHDQGIRLREASRRRPAHHHEDALGELLQLVGGGLCGGGERRDEKAQDDEESETTEPGGGGERRAALRGHGVTISTVCSRQLEGRAMRGATDTIPTRLSRARLARFSPLPSAGQGSPRPEPRGQGAVESVRVRRLSRRSHRSVPAGSDAWW